MAHSRFSRRIGFVFQFKPNGIAFGEEAAADTEDICRSGRQSGFQAA